jgi:hypothetical protein
VQITSPGIERTKRHPVWPCYPVCKAGEVSVRGSGTYVGLGMALGVAIGAATDHVGMGLALGLILGAAIGVVKAKRNEPPNT